MEVPGLADLAGPWQPGPWRPHLPKEEPGSSVGAQLEGRQVHDAPNALGAAPGRGQTELWPIGAERFQCDLIPKFLEDDIGASSSSTRSTSRGEEASNHSGDQGDEADGGTNSTVMMRNIPSEFTGAMLLTLLNRKGFKGSYDLVYLPMDYHNKVGFGYAFINFVEPSLAKAFRRAFEGFREWGLVSDKVCEVCWSNVLQGVDAHIERYRNSPVMHPTVPETFKPMLFVDGQQVPFPAPTKTIRPPRLRKKQQ